MILPVYHIHTFRHDPVSIPLKTHGMSYDLYGEIHMCGANTNHPNWASSYGYLSDWQYAKVGHKLYSPY